jgi:hypothetical protein
MEQMELVPFCVALPHPAYRPAKAGIDRASAPIRIGLFPDGRRPGVFLGRPPWFQSKVLGA